MKSERLLTTVIGSSSAAKQVSAIAPITKMTSTAVTHTFRNFLALRGIFFLFFILFVPFILQKFQIDLKVCIVKGFHVGDILINFRKVFDRLAGVCRNVHHLNANSCSYTFARSPSAVSPRFGCFRMSYLKSKTGRSPRINRIAYRLSNSRTSSGVINSRPVF